MAGNPLAKLLPYIKKYGTEIFIILGPLLWLKQAYGNSKIYKNVYSENDFQRQYQLENLKKYIKEHDKKKELPQAVAH
jgi:hypothetical protein